MLPSTVSFFATIVVDVACWGVSPVCVPYSATIILSLSVCTIFSHFCDGIVSSDLLILDYCVRHVLRLSADSSPRVKVSVDFVFLQVCFVGVCVFTFMCIYACVPSYSSNYVYPCYVMAFTYTLISYHSYLRHFILYSFRYVHF